MTLLAYDPDGLLRLCRVLDFAVHDLTRLDLSDPCAASAAEVVRQSVAAFSACQRAAIEIVRSTAMTREQIYDLAARDPRIRELFDDGWWFTPDRLELSVDQVTALADWLAAADSQWFAQASVDQLQALADQLTIIAATPFLHTALASRFTDFDRLCDDLADRRRTLTASFDAHKPADGSKSADTITAIDALFSAVARYVGTAVTGMGCSPDALALVVSSFPYADPAAKADAAAQVLRRWLDAPGTFDRPGPDAGDVLFEWLLADPDAAVRFVAIGAVEPDLLFRTAARFETVHALVNLATDPAVIGPSTAATFVPALVENTLLTDWPSADIDLLLADVIAPWLLYFGRTNFAWGPDSAHRSDLVGQVVQWPRARDRLLADAERRTAGLVAASADGTVGLGDVVGALTLLYAAATHADVAAEETKRETIQWGVDALGIATGAVAATPAAGALTDLAATTIGAIADGTLTDPEAAAAAGSERLSEMWALTAAASLRTSFARLVANGEVPATLAPPPEPDLEADDPAAAYLDSATRWIDDAGFDDRVRAQLDDIVDVTLSPAAINLNGAG